MVRGRVRDRETLDYVWGLLPASASLVQWAEAVNNPHGTHLVITSLEVDRDRQDVRTPRWVLTGSHFPAAWETGSDC